MATIYGVIDSGLFNFSGDEAVVSWHFTRTECDWAIRDLCKASGRDARTYLVREFHDCPDSPLDLSLTDMALSMPEMLPEATLSDLAYYLELDGQVLLQRILRGLEAGLVTTAVVPTLETTMEALQLRLEPQATH